MEGLIATVPSNEELEREPGSREFGAQQEACVWGYRTDSWYVTGCGIYPKETGQFTELRALGIPGRVYLQVGRPPLSVNLVGATVVFRAVCGVSLAIGGDDTYVSSERLLEEIPLAGFSEDTTLQVREFPSLFETFSPLSIANFRVQSTQRSFERFIERINKPGYRPLPMIRSKGIPVWAIAAYVLDLGLSFEEVVSDWGGEITVDEVKAAMEYYRAYPQEVEQKRRWDCSR